MQEHHLVAYIEDEGSRDAISLALKELSFTNFQVFSGSAKTAATNLIRLGNPKLLIVDVSSSTLPLSDISELAEVCEAGTKVIVIGSRNDVSLFRQLIQMGICDYLVKPVNTGLVKKSLLSIFENRGVPKATTRLSKQVAVIGVKGGVGASTIASSLAHHMSVSIKRKVLLLDLNPCLGDLALLNDVPPSKELGTYLATNRAIDSVLYESFVTRISDYLFVASPRIDIGDCERIFGEGLDNFIESVKSKFHYIVIDMPVCYICSGHITDLSSYHTLFVLNPNISCLQNMDMLLSTTSTFNGSMQKTFVVNKFGESKANQFNLESFGKIIGGQVDVVVPYDGAQCLQGTNSGDIKQAYGGKLGKSIQKLGEIVSGNNNPKKPSLFERILSGI